MGALGMLGGGGTSLQMSNSATATADQKAAQQGSLGSYGPRGVSLGTIGGIGSSSGSGISTGVAILLAVGAALAVWWFKR